MEKGTKRKIEIKKRDTKMQRVVAFSKRRQTVFSKAADLCLLSGANIAVFVTSPADNSDVIHSFSGFSPASEIADCYLNGKLPSKVDNPQSKLGFWWEDPDLYHSCDDISELNTIEDCIKRMTKDLMACLEKKENSQLASSSFDQEENPSDHSIDLDENRGGSSSEFVSDSDQKPNSLSPSLAQFASFDRNYLHLGSDDNCLGKTEKENSQISLPQETQTQAMINVGEDQRFCDSLCNDDAFGLNNDFVLDNNNNNRQANTTNDRIGESGDGV